MRGLRWAAGTIVVVALLGFTAAVFFFGMGTRDCIASLALPTIDTRGEVVAKDGGAVTFRVDEVVADDRNPAPQPTTLEPGQEIVVRYSGGDARFLHTGQSYLVPVYGSEVDGFHSGVHTPQECDTPTGTGTRHADGSAIDTGLFTRDGFAPYVPKLLMAVGAVAAVALLVRWRIRVKHPRLTIDGKPLTKR